MRFAVTSEREPRRLSSEERIQRGVFYTPENLVCTVHSLIESYKTRPRAVIFDSAAGDGAFIRSGDRAVYKAAEQDPAAAEILKNKIPPKNVFAGNALLNACRQRFHIAPKDFLIQIGNPPYNDVTSAYKKGQKGENICDQDLFDRDLAVSFIKSYNKLKADVVCVLHPLSCLIKEANFKRLKGFAENYKLKKAFLFSSGEFQNTSRTHFPIAVALYEKNQSGMSFEEVRRFPFRILGNEQQIFRLIDFPSTDGFIRKYPPRKFDPQTSDIGVYYRSFRDINSLMRNQDFHLPKSPFSIAVQAADFYKYCYLFAFKQLFRPKNLWLYGNLSPIGEQKTVEKHKRLFVRYALLSKRRFFAGLSGKARDKIARLSFLQKTNGAFRPRENKELKRLLEPPLF